jgi:rubrerythrin
MAEAKMTRGGLVGAAAAAAGGAALIGRRGTRPAGAAPSRSQDQRILAFFLTLEQVQEAFYTAAIAAGKLDGELDALARTVRDQERRHVARLGGLLGAAAEAAPKTNFGAALATAVSFRNAAVELEEAAIAGYIGQSAHLRKDTMRAIATLVSVEARQVAWLRGVAGMSPAPRAADPPRDAGAVLAFLRGKGYLA